MINVIQHLLNYGLYNQGEYAALIEYLRSANKEYIPSVTNQLNSILRDTQLDNAGKIAAFNSILDEYQGKVDSDVDYNIKSLYCIIYLYTWAYKESVINFNEVPVEHINEIRSYIDYICTLYNIIKNNKNLNLTYIDKVIDILRRYIIIIDTPLDNERNQKFIYAWLNADAIITVEDVEHSRHVGHSLLELNHISCFIYLQSQFMQLDMETDSDKQYNSLLELRHKIITQLSQDDANHDYVFISILAKLYIHYKAQYILYNNKWQEHDLTVDFKKVAPQQLPALESYLEFEQKLNNIFKHYLEFYKYYNDSNMDWQKRALKLMAISNRIMHIAGCPMLLKEISILELRQKVIGETTGWILGINLSLESYQDLTQKLRFISEWQQHLNDLELNHLLKNLTEWQAEPELSANNLQAVLRCKSTIEKHYIDTLDFNQLMDYYDDISAETEKLPKRDFLPADIDRRLTFEHDSNIRSYAAQALDKLRPGGWYKCYDRHVEFGTRDGTYPNIRPEYTARQYLDF